MCYFRKMKYAFLAVFLLLFQGIKAQIPLNEINELRQRRDFRGAFERVDEYLKSNPGTAPEWQLHAELMFMDYLSAKIVLSVLDLPDEDIFTDDLFKKPSAPKLPDSLATKMISSLLKATEKDPTLSSAHFALCLTYAQAGFTRDLITYLPVFNVSQPDNIDVPELMSDFADKFIERGEFEQGMQVYATIVMLHPQNGDIQSKMARLFFEKGLIKPAEAYIRMFLASGSAYAESYASMFECSSLLGMYDEAEASLVLLCGLEKRTIYLVYQGLYAWYKNENPDPFWLKFQNSPEDTGSMASMVRYMRLPGYRNSLQDFEYLIRLDLPDPFKIMIFEKFRLLFPESCATRHYFTELLTSYQRYQRALEIFYGSEIAHCDSNIISAHHLYAGWCEYRLLNYSVAADHFSKIQNSPVPYHQSCACYFLGKIREKSGDLKAAKEFYQSGKIHAETSKFGKLCEMNLSVLEHRDD